VEVAAAKRQPSRVTRAIVHVGYHKTATTWFQKSVYPRVRNYAYLPRERVNRAFLDASAFQFDAAACRAALALPADRPPILCEEALSGALMVGGMMGFQSAAAADRIHAVLPEARIVVFVRSQPEMISAAYLQYLRNGGTHTLHRFLLPGDYRRADGAIPRHDPAFDLDHFEYDRLIAHYVERFGASRVLVFAYEDLRRDTRAFLERFAKLLELDLDVASVPIEKRNASYSLTVSRLARLLNRFTVHAVPNKHHWIHVPGWYAPRKRLLEVASRSGLFGRRAPAERLLGPDTLRFLRARYWESNRRLAERTGLDLRSLGWTLDPPAEAAPRPRGGFAQRWLSR
jgi:hypothetical protein